MRICSSTKRERGLTIVELLVVMVVVGFLTLMMLEMSRPISRAKARAPRIQCVNNLKQTGLAYRIWAGDHADTYPMSVSQTNGGSMEFISGTNAFRHFQVMSNELSTPKVLVCPDDRDRYKNCATNFTAFGNANLSFFVGIDATETNPTMILSGDRNITNGTPMQNGLLRLTTNSITGWTSEAHEKVGNILLADGSVQQLSTTGLNATLANTPGFTNRLLMPVLGP
jgi:type II secretory pathway pseudopilin PulG